MKIAVSTEQIGTMNAGILEILEILDRAGYRAVDFNAGNYARAHMNRGDTPFLGDHWREWVLEIKRRADDLHMEFVQSHNLIFNYFAPGNNQAALLDAVDRAIEACAMLCAKVSVMHPVMPPAAKYDAHECMRENVRFFMKRGRLAKSLGVSIAIENMIAPMDRDGKHIAGFCSSPDELMELVDRIDQENVGICLDTGHANCMGGRPGRVHASVWKQADRAAHQRQRRAFRSARRAFRWRH